METLEELQAFLADATQDGVWGRLLDRGAAWAIMRQDGELPGDAPPLGDTIDTDLAEYGFSVLRAALALKEARGPTDIAQRAFEKAANAFEALVRNGSPEAVERDFYRVIAGAAYHLAGYSAIAYSLFNQVDVGTNATPAEVALIRLILRDFDALRIHTRDWLREESHGDRALAAQLEADEIEPEDVIATILNSAICGGLSYFDFALQTGEASLLESAKAILAGTVKLAADAGVVSHWWVARLCLNLIDDLWGHSLHVNLPLAPPLGGEADYDALRRMFLISLYGRKNGEVELWPSQREAARRSSDVTDDLVVSLPTSAGKTRVAEIAALMTLSAKKRVLLVTPLRALSAQTERSFRKTFGVLGFTVSSLYGASGVSAGDEDALRSRDIIIATPEKLDFALRHDPTLIIVLDEGHLIGPSEREIRYEVLVQRLLRREDSATRRMVCLSAILPDGDQLDDLTGWIRHDAPGDPVRSAWRPTRQRFGSLTWRGRSARLNFDLDVRGPFIARFIEEIPPRGQQKKPYPREVQDLCLFAAWNFAAQDKRALIFCTQANWVEGYGETALDLVQRGYLPLLLDKPDAISRALEVGREWLGDGHPAVECLKIGLAIHHGGLPNPFLRELEVLLSEGILKIIVASPTLSQGLNLNAAVLLVPSLYRSGKPITGEEFANVAGRAGRAFVDIEGLTVHVMYNPEPWRITQWRSLVASARARALKSGLIQIVWEVMQRLAKEGVLYRPDAIEYLANSREAWVPAADQSSSGGSGDDETEPLSHLVERLDAAVFSLIEALDADSSDLPRLLDEALQGSLWARQIVREREDWQPWYRAVLLARASVIWNHTTPASRRGHFAMGVGLDAGLALDAMADELANYIDIADLAALRGDGEELAGELTELGRRLLVMRPFIPDKRNALPPNWPQILKAWVTGVDVNVIRTDNMAMVEDAFSYRLVWAIEAVRARRTTLGWSPDIVGGGGAASLETGVPCYAMAMLIRAGLPSRLAAIAAVRETRAMFFDNAGMKSWLESNEVAAFTDTGEWPTLETAALWQRFREDLLSGGIQKWRHQTRWSSLTRDHSAPTPGIYRVEVEERTGIVWLCSPDQQRLARLRRRLRDTKPSFLSARIVAGDARAYIERFGRDGATWLTD